MQPELGASQTWTQSALLLLTSFLTGGVIVKLYNTWLHRKKPKADIHLSEAQTDKTRAEARRIRVQADAEFSATFERLHARIDQMQEEASRCHAERDRYHAERDEYKMRVDLQAIELRLRDAEVKQLVGELHARGIRLSDRDIPIPHTPKDEKDH